MKLKVIWSATGRSLGMIEEHDDGLQNILSPSGRILGQVNALGTFDVTQRKISSDRLPGYFFGLSAGKPPKRN